MPPSTADVLAELTTLADAGEDALRRLRGGDTTALGELNEQRLRVAALLRTLPSRDASLERAVRTAQAMDTEIVMLLRRQQGEIARHLERLVATKHTLKSYGAARGRSALYFEKLG